PAGQGTAPPRGTRPARESEPRGDGGAGGRAWADARPRRVPVCRRLGPRPVDVPACRARAADGSPFRAAIADVRSADARPPVPIAPAGTLRRASRADAPGTAVPGLGFWPAADVR